MAKYENTVSLYKDDFNKTLFPLDTNLILIENASDSLGKFIYEKITHQKKSEYHFLPQTRAYAAKQGLHLRRTAKLDPVAEFFLYDIAYRNKALFRKSYSDKKLNFGYRFEKGEQISAAASYQNFKSHVRTAAKKHKYCAKFDISSYFNSIYHHDLTIWFNKIGASEEDSSFFDKFFKQINSGRSIDCLPHGIYPAKMIGSHYLKFIDNSARLESELLYRFMDDFYIFSDSLEKVEYDFIQIQRMLGERGLSINPTKTKIGDIDHLGLEKQIDAVKKGLLKHRYSAVVGSGGEAQEGIEDGPLNENEVEYLFNLLKREQIEEEDAELVLSLLRHEGDDILEFIPTFLARFPNLSKNIYYFCEHIEDKENLSSIVNSYLENNSLVTEFQLFWLAKLAESQLSGTQQYGDILIRCFEHQNSTEISKAKVLEIPELRFSMSDLREEHLRTGASNWLSWASAVGSRAENRINRNHVLGYFSNGSHMNSLISECIANMS